MAKPKSKFQEHGTDQQRIGAIYAKALLAATERAGTSRPVVEELASLLRDVLDRFPALETALASPRIAKEKKIASLDRVFDERMSPELLTFLKVVAERGRLDCLRAIEREARRQFNEAEGRVEVRLTTAEPVNGDLEGQISRSLARALGGELDLEQTVDPRLIGGMLVRVGDMVYDASVANGLARLRRQALSKARENIQGELRRFFS
jgi:F-type H+-transporting ATPase subunit delta